MEIDLALLADAATIDVSGKLNILGIFDRISVPSFPTSHPHLALVFRLSASMDESGQHRVEIILRDPDGEEAKMPPIRGDLQVRPGQGGGFGQTRIRIPQVVNIDRLRFEKAGKYTFHVSVDGEERAAVPLMVVGGPPSVMPGRPPAEA